MKTILVPVDFNPHAAAALRHAVELAQKSEARIVVMYADRFDPPTEFTARQTGEISESIDESRRQTLAALERYAREIVPAGIELRAVVREELPVPAILHEAEAQNADLIVMGSHGHGAIARLLLGSVSAGVKKATKRPVVTVPA
jgi:nucleotide-binding universal stress UspA family protein